MNRLCPSEETLSEYISGILPEEEKPPVEKHLASCNICRKLLLETYDITNKPDLNELKVQVIGWIIKNKWLTGAAGALILSFFFPKYFLQFLSAAVVLGAKWIIDAKTTRTLIMINEAYKENSKIKIKNEKSKESYKL